MSEYINAKRLYKGKTFDEVKRLFPNCIWKKIPNIRVKAYSSNTGLVFKDRTISYSSVLYDCNNDLNVYTRLCLLGGKSNKAHRYIISAFLGESNLEVNHHTKWTEEHKQKYREYLKSRPRDNYGRFTKGGGV